MQTFTCAITFEYKPNRSIMYNILFHNIDFSNLTDTPIVFNLNKVWRAAVITRLVGSGVSCSKMIQQSNIQTKKWLILYWQPEAKCSDQVVSFPHSNMIYASYLPVGSSYNFKCPIPPSQIRRKSVTVSF